MTRFDEPVRGSVSGARPGGAMSAGLHLLSTRPAVTAALVLMTSVVLLAAMALIAVRGIVPAALSSAFASSPIMVFAAATASKGEVSALGARLKELPLVADVVLRPKEEAMVSLIQAGLPATSEARNPLPDAWIVRLHPAEGDHTSFVTTATSLRDAASALPGVDQVRIDARWDERLERWSDNWKRFARPAVDVGLVVLALALSALWFVAAGPVRQVDEPLANRGASSKRALALYQLVVLLLSSLVAAVVGALLLTTFPILPDPRWKPWVLLSGQTGLWIVVGVTTAGAFCGFCGVFLGARR